MENQFIVHQLKAIAAATSEIEQQNNQVKNTLCLLLGYIKADEEFTKPLEGGLFTQPIYKETDMSEILEFTQQEISKMPKEFRKIFKTNDIRAHVRKRVRGNSISYEIRYRRKGLNISANAPTLEAAKTKFIQKLQKVQNKPSMPAAPDVPTAFDKFAMYYFETFRKRKVQPNTYKKDLIRLKVQLIPYFGSLPLKEITPQYCQMLIDSIVAEGKRKTASEVFSLLNQTFKMAIRHSLIQYNPLDIVYHEKHESEHGKALTSEEEKHLLQTAVEPFRTLFAIGLYTGIRPNEYATVQIIGNMVYARNSKRKGGKQETKRIPITPMLRPYVTPDTIIEKKSPDQLRDAFNAIFNGSHKLYDLRTTFYTRCKMCGVAEAARDEFVGHSSGILGNTYTDLPDDYLIKEGQKLDY
ncbi:MAG: site-specific integrase [Clostridiales bacterium]|nr:site-specific integrase [Clostridiales bacterium]